ncbi:type I-G CRISPR-associated RAMP protein Csb1/Cas7g [Actinomadura atramentaria]|uniref:type I-G CRISPR-associated RAMP protein Csb1/Cas7g n=1 Tax=Actinomadura atramentaria TaxID=1990 RepID=UPI00036EE974|nr:type I-U CRISPR-associated RAMP protein Csb1/Cas7u [Actinomadura atramentaria]
MSRNLEYILAATAENRIFAGISSVTSYSSPSGEKVFPPSYPFDRDDESRYLWETRLVEGKPRKVVVLDQVPSQANRVEAALLRARDAGKIRLPLFEITMTASDGLPVRLTSLEAPHRFADAYLRDSLLEGTKFDKSEVGRRLRAVLPADVRPLFELSPESLVFGAWDSHRKGRGVKVARSYSSTVVGFDPVEGQRKSGRMDPLNLTGAVGSTADDWEFVASGEKKKGSKLSELGHGNVRPNPAHGGVVISGARRSAWLSLSGLGNLRFGDASEEAAHLARATLVALALAGDRLAFGGPSLWLRSGCDLVRAEQRIAFEGPDGAEELQVTADEAVAVFDELRDRTADAGIVMSTETYALTPQPGLAAAIDYALTRTDAGEEG